MTGRRRLRGIGAALLAASAVVLAWPAGGASAQTPDAVGWWYRPQQSGTPVAIPAPPTVPKGGLYVAQGPNSENVALAAVEYAIAGPGTATLTLKPAAGSAGTVAVTACPLSAGFTPIEAGPWDQVPAYNCTSASVDGVVAADGTITFALTTAFVAAGNTAMQAVLIPTPGSAPFQVPIEAPGDASFAAVTTPTGDPSSTDSSATDSFSSAPAESFDGGSAALPPSFDAPVDGGAPATSPSGTPGVALRPSRPRRPAVPIAASRELGDRLAAVVGLALIGAAMWWLGGRPTRSPQLLGGASTGDVTVGAVALSTTRPGGIGRFVRPRSAPPNRL